MSFPVWRQRKKGRKRQQMTRPNLNRVHKPQQRKPATHELLIDLEEPEVVDLDDVSEPEQEVIEIASDPEELREEIIIGSDDNELISEEESQSEAWFYWSPPVLRTFSEWLISVGNRHTDESNTRLTSEGCGLVRGHLEKHHITGIVPDSLSDLHIDKNLDKLYVIYMAYLSLIGCGWLHYNRTIGSFQPAEKKTKPDDILEDLEDYLRECEVRVSLIDVSFFFNENLHFLDDLHYFYKKDDWAVKVPVASRAHERIFRIPKTRAE